MRFSKWHAHGNAYLVVDAPVDAARVRRLCDPNVGVGADGVVEIGGVDGATADVRIWNPDGSIAELSGNGVRIAARWLAQRTGDEAVRIRVEAREAAARMLDDDDVEVELGEVRVGEAEEIDGIRFVPVDVGNPHAVVLGDPAQIERVGPLLETHPRFPARTNVQVVRVDETGRVTARVWERGVGETAASGSSAVAVAAATHPEGGEVVVRFPGGDLRVRLEGGRALLTGPAVEICRGELFA